MRYTYIFVWPIVTLSLLGCRSAPERGPNEVADNVTDKVAVTTPAAQPLPAVASSLPPAGAPEGVDLAYDHRGGFGPVRNEHVDVVLAQARARCRRVSGHDETVEGTLSLDAALVGRLQEASRALRANPSRTVRRPALVQDLGVMTLSVGLDAPLVVDGAVTLDPYPESLVQELVQLKDRCLEAPLP